jgi:hypothetical protein
VGVDVANPEGVAISEQVVPLRAVGGEIRPVVKTLPEFLHVLDLFADGGRCACFLLEISRCREMVGVRMGVEYPLDRVALAGNKFEQTVGIGRCGLP